MTLSCQCRGCGLTCWSREKVGPFSGQKKGSISRLAAGTPAIWGQGRREEEAETKHCETPSLLAPLSLTPCVTLAEVSRSCTLVYLSVKWS